MTLSEKQEALCTANETDFSGLSALLFNTSLKLDAGDSHTQILLNVVAEMMQRNGVAVEHVNMASAGVPAGVYPDMTEHGHDSDGWPAIWDRVQAADILVIGTPLWLGEESSLCRVLIERLYGMSGMLNDKGQSIYYGKVGGCVVTGNEDGIKHAAMTIGYALSHLGVTIPPQADCGWIGEAGPGPSFGDALEDGTRAGFDNDFTQRNTTIMTWNLMHMARMLKQAGGLPNHGNDRRAWAAGCRFDYDNPEHRS
ncbi:flavodoxin family protein [Tropicimonas sediminicola]|uniref:Multimeric flavodoxin WrbA n=1 Tax=Tropicimonas sediminicola TaxID=1031541 RepID=A0A239HHG1_9RHOB|nr:NAD(P)H-dependent oxidoreductase [Tropicimonas sediminicola]SNS80263.1 Multimeric flavodoxin WrbA [Tropicimonas sediminicola]